MLFYSQALLVHFGTLFISMELCLCVCTCAFDILGRGGERGQIAASLSHIIGQLSFIHRNESTPPPSTYPARYDTCICPLLSSKSTHSTHSECMRVSACVSSCQKV